MDDKRLRPFCASGSFGLKQRRRCLKSWAFAAPSFHSRSRRKSSKQRLRWTPSMILRSAFEAPAQGRAGPGDRSGSASTADGEAPPTWARLGRLRFCEIQLGRVNGRLKRRGGAFLIPVAEHWPTAFPPAPVGFAQRDMGSGRDRCQPPQGCPGSSPRIAAKVCAASVCRALRQHLVQRPPIASAQPAIASRGVFDHEFRRSALISELSVTVAHKAIHGLTRDRKHRPPGSTGSAV